VDIYLTLHADHERLKRLLQRVEEATELNEDTSELLHGVSHLLIPHSRAEEEVFYNSIRACDSGNDVVMHGYREHMEAEGLLRALQGMSMIGVEWTAAARKLREAIEHHIEEEETNVFEVARKLFDAEEATQLGHAFLALKSEIGQEGVVGNAIRLVKNLMPPRFRSEQGEQGQQGEQGRTNRPA
jgi:hypothetical protein